MISLIKIKQSASLAALAFAGMFFIQSNANAAPVILNVDSNIAANQYVASSPVSGLFDLSAWLATHDVVSGTITATFTDNADAYQNTGSSTVTSYDHIYNCFGCVQTAQTVWANENTYYNQTNTTYYSNALETALLTFGSVSGNASSNFYDNGVVYQGSQQTNIQTVNQCAQNSVQIGNSIYSANGKEVCVTHTDHFNISNYSGYAGYTGNFSITLGLDSLALNFLNESGLLNFDIASGAGDFLITGITLNANLADAQIPEPVSIALLGIGLLGFGVSRRRKQ